MDNRNSSCGRGCGCKCGVVLSLIALVIAGATYFYPKKTADPCSSSTFDEKVKSIVLDVVKQNPQLLMDAMGEGIAKKREETLKKLVDDVSEKGAEVSKLCLKYGKLDSKTTLTCFFDPLNEHCIEFLRSMVKLVKAKKDVCFKMMPVAVLGDDSILLSRVYIAAYDKNPEKSLTFIDKIVNSDGNMDKAAIEKALKAAGLDNKEIEGMMNDSDKKLIENGKFAESLKIPVVPAIFLHRDGKVTLLQTTDTEQLIAEIEGKPEK